MKRFRIFCFGMLVFTGASLTLFGQQNKIKLVSAINTVEEIFAEVYPGNHTGIHISVSGMVEEWDSTYHYTMRYDLRDIDLSLATVVENKASKEMYIDLLCKQQQNCIKLTEHGKGHRYYSNAQAFAMPASEERKLEEILLQLKLIQQNLGR
jgi:hypothetical protein